MNQKVKSRVSRHFDATYLERETEPFRNLAVIEGLGLGSRSGGLHGSGTRNQW